MKNISLHLILTSVFVFFVSINYVSAQPQTVALTVDSPNGRVTGKSVYGPTGALSTSTGLPPQVAKGKRMTLMVSPIVEGYSCSEVTVTCSLENGEQIETVITPTVKGGVIIPADYTQGDMTVYAPFVKDEECEQYLVFDDEFDGKEGAAVNGHNWRTCDRYSSAWNRFVSRDRRVACIRGGSLSCRAIVNPGDIDDTAEMISGAKDTKGHFAFNHGYVEARILTVPHKGSFPAFWLMPVDQSAGWPSCGEIDIWEMIDTQNIAYHTVHSHWTYDLGNKTTPSPNGGSEACTQAGEWHTYGLLKETDKMTWYVDGVAKFSYSKSSDENMLSQGQWPFDKAFYIIVNQSVGNGSWAANPDKSFVYETLFDWVRVYQTEVEANADKNKIDGLVPLTTDERPSTKQTYDLYGRSVEVPRSGFYIQNGHKVIL